MHTFKEIKVTSFIYSKLFHVIFRGREYASNGVQAQSISLVCPAGQTRGENFRGTL